MTAPKELKAKSWIDKPLPDEDALELRKIYDIVFRGKEYIFRKEEDIRALSPAEILEAVKKNIGFDTQDILLSRDDLPLKTLEYIYRKNKGLRLPLAFYKSPVPMELSRIKRAKILGFIACHPNASFDLLLKIAKHESPEARFIATGNPFLPPSIKQDIYRGIIENHGYGDSLLLLRTLCKNDLPGELRNKGLQKLFASDSFIEDERRDPLFPEELPIKDRKYPEPYSFAESSKYFLVMPLKERQYELQEVLRGLALIDGLSMETVDTILKSGHRSSTIHLYSNKNLPVEAYGKFLNREVITTRNWKDVMLLEYLAGNPSAPPELLQEITGMILPDLSYKQRGATFSATGGALAKNPSTPLEALLTLHSLHNIEASERVVNGTATPEDYEAETSGPPARLWFAVEEHPTYKKWVEETPNYKDLLPPVIKCTCHNL